jgi:hypothetical protein
MACHKPASNSIWRVRDCVVEMSIASLAYDSRWSPRPPDPLTMDAKKKPARSDIGSLLSKLAEQDKLIRVLRAEVERLQKFITNMRDSDHTQPSQADTLPEVERFKG